MRAMIAAPAAVRSSLPLVLAEHGIACDPVEALGDLAEALAADGQFDIILLDVGRLHGDAAVALRALRRRGRLVPAIVLCSGLADAAEETLLDAGADDVLPYPIRPASLLARMRVVVRRAAGVAPGLLQHGALSLDQEDRLVRWAGRRVPLTRREFDVMEQLMLRRGRLVTRAGLLASLYGGRERGERVIDVFLMKVRRRLAAAGAVGVIRTVHGCGWVLDAVPAGGASGAVRAAG